MQIRKEPKEASRERAQLAKEANEAKRKTLAVKNEGKTKMKGKNRPSKSYRKKKTNIIEEKKVEFDHDSYEIVLVGRSTQAAGVSCFH